MPKPYFFYATGTATMFSLFNGKGFGDIGLLAGGNKSTLIPGYNGRNGVMGGSITTDPFPSMLDPTKWTSIKIGYPAAAFPMLSSIMDGVGKTVTNIDKLDKGTPFALGGYSQGAAVMSLVLKNCLQSHSYGGLGFPNITSRYGDLKAAVMFGNPCRQVNKLWGAFKSYAGGTVSATTANPTGTSGGHGALSTSYRITTTPSYWFEFVGNRLQPVDPVTSIGDDSVGLAFSAAGDLFLTYSVLALPALLADPNVQAVLGVGAEGHMGYPLLPPPGYPSTAPSSYQIALEYLDMIGDQLATAPTQIPVISNGATISVSSRSPGFRPSTPTTVLPPPPVRGRGFR